MATNLALLLLLPAPAVLADQEGAQCDSLPADVDKLRCFRAVVRQLEERLAGPGEHAAGTGGQPPAPIASSAEPQPPAPRAAAAPTPTPAARAAERPVPTAAPRPADDRIEILGISRGPLGNLTVRLANGEVWRQLDSDNTRVLLPQEQETLYAVIDEGFLGSRRMKIVGTARSFRVRRVD